MQKKKSRRSTCGREKKNGRQTSAQKRDKQSLKARLRNRSFKATVTTAIRVLKKLLQKATKL